MPRTPRPRRLRRRDLHVLIAVAVVALSNVATTALYWIACRTAAPRAVAVALVDVTNRLVRVEGFADANGAAILALHEAVTSLSDGLGSGMDAGTPAVPVMLGAGTIRTRNGSGMLYMDYRFPDGSTERRYSRPFPAPRRGNGGGTSPPSRAEPEDGTSEASLQGPT